MSYFEFLVGTPFFWITLAGLWSGASLSRVSRPASRIALYRSGRGANLELIRSRSLSLFYLGMSAAMVCAIAGIFVPGSRKILDERLIWTYAAATILSFLGFRFRRAAGFPLLLLCSLVVLAGAAALSPYTVVREPRDALALRPLSIDENGTELEIIEPASLPTDHAFFHVNSIAVKATVQMLTFSDYLFPVGGTAASSRGISGVIQLLSIG